MFSGQMRPNYLIELLILKGASARPIVFNALFWFVSVRFDFVQINSMLFGSIRIVLIWSRIVVAKTFLDTKRTKTVKSATTPSIFRETYSAPTVEVTACCNHKCRGKRQEEQSLGVTYRSFAKWHEPIFLLCMS